ncbi:MAG: hypothetical protein CL875_01280 [Dehalococcoidales bacterium]|nr:hypothetical protein [Dehalococcoidales bacterium]
MTFTLDPISLTNLILSVIILALGIAGYKNSDDKAPLFIGIAFGLFGVSHLMTLLGLKETLAVLLIIIRTIAYVMVAVPLFWIAFKRY